MSLSWSTKELYSSFGKLKTSSLIFCFVLFEEGISELYIRLLINSEKDKFRSCSTKELYSSFGKLKTSSLIFCFVLFEEGISEL